jgi:hypothetical protein
MKKPPCAHLACNCSSSVGPRQSKALPTHRQLPPLWPCECALWTRRSTRVNACTIRPSPGKIKCTIMYFKWKHWDLNPRRSACEADVIPLVCRPGLRLHAAQLAPLPVALSEPVLRLPLPAKTDARKTLECLCV